MIIRLAITALLSLGFVLTACHKDNEKDYDSPVILVYEPDGGDTLSMAIEDSVHIEFYVTDNTEIHEVSVNITDINGANVYNTLEDVDDSVFYYHEHFFPTNITGVTKFTILIEASDHSENVASEKRVFYVEP